VQSVFDLIGGYTRQHIVVARMTGKEIRAALDKTFAKKRATTLAVSWLSLECEVRDGAPVVRALSIGGAPVEPDKAYTVAAQAGGLSADLQRRQNTTQYAYNCW